MSGSKCRVCRAPAIIDLPRHNANFCAEHLLQLCRRQVEKAIKDYDMLSRHDRILVAVSGGKDSLAVWDILDELGYSADGLYIGLGIGEYSDVSYEFTRCFADERGLRLTTVDLRDEYGYDVPTAAKVTKRVPCSACGMSKRHIFDQAARDGGYDVVVTGHNLDDEAAVLFGNTLRWDIDYLARQLPVLPRARRVPEEGQAAGSPDRARDGGVVHRPGDRLPGRGVPDGGRQQAPRVQGGAQLDRARVAGFEGGVLSRVRRQDGAPAGGAPLLGTGPTAVVHVVWCADHGTRLGESPCARSAGCGNAAPGSNRCRSRWCSTRRPARPIWPRRWPEEEMTDAGFGPR